MTPLSRILSLIGAVLFMPLVLWFAIAFLAGEAEYLALVRSGFLLLGLMGIGWGLLRQQPRIAYLGFAFIAVGFLTFLQGFALSVPEFNYDWLHQLKARLTYPLSHRSGLHLWHLALVAVVVLNGLLIGREANSRQIAGANLVLLAALIFAVFVVR